MKTTEIEAWNTCQRGDWMLCFAQKLDCPIRQLSLTKGLCAKTVFHLMKDERSRNAVKVAIDFGNGVATREELDAASDAANAAAADAFADDAAGAADTNAAYAASAAADANADANAAADSAADAASYAASDAANADYAAACDASASYADEAADEAAAAAADAAADAAKKENQQQTADICRRILTDFVKSVLQII